MFCVRAGRVDLCLPLRHWTTPCCAHQSSVACELAQRRWQPLGGSVRETTTLLVSAYMAIDCSPSVLLPAGIDSGWRCRRHGKDVCCASRTCKDLVSGATPSRHALSLNVLDQRSPHLAPGQAGREIVGLPDAVVSNCQGRVGLGAQLTRVHHPGRVTLGLLRVFPDVTTRRSVLSSQSPIPVTGLLGADGEDDWEGRWANS